MIRIGIAEDVQAEQQRLITYLHQYEAEHNEIFRIDTYYDGSALLEEYPKDCDLLLLDIKMKPMNGMDAAKSIRSQDENVIIIFITNVIQYALDGYKVDAMNYMLKPVSYEVFSLQMDKALQRIGRRRPASLRIKTAEGVMLVDVHDITYIETSQHKVTIHTRMKTLLCRESMSHMEELLKEYPFFRCHAAYLVNLDYVEQINGYDLYVNGSLLSISRYRRQEFLDSLSAHIGG